MRYPLLAICFSVLFIGCLFTDMRDKRALRKRCGIPSYAELVSYVGFPAMNGFGQREALEVSGKYKLKPEHVSEFEKSASREGWESLPIPNETRSKISFQGMEVNLDAKNGFFRCRTAGDNVLYSSVSIPCKEVSYLSDIMISVYERQNATLSAVVRSGY